MTTPKDRISMVVSNIYMLHQVYAWPIADVSCGTYLIADFTIISAPDFIYFVSFHMSISWALASLGYFILVVYILFHLCLFESHW